MASKRKAPEQKIKLLKKRKKEVFQEKAGYKKNYATRSGRKVRRPNYYSPTHEEDMYEDDVDYALNVVNEIEKNPDYSHSEDDSASSDPEIDESKVAQELKGFITKQLTDKNEDGDYIPSETSSSSESESESEREVDYGDYHDNVKKELEDLQNEDIDENKEKEAEEQEVELTEVLGLQEEQEELSKPILERHITIPDESILLENKNNNITLEIVPQPPVPPSPKPVESEPEKTSLVRQEDSENLSNLPAQDSL
jgi:hypothetical protein